MVKKIRPIRIDGDVAYIPLADGPDAPCAIIDADDVELVDGVNWSEGTKLSGRRAVWDAKQRGWPRVRGYVVRGLPSRRILLLHRYLLGAVPKDRVGFSDRDPYNCRRSNLILQPHKERGLRHGISREGALYRVDTQMPDGVVGFFGRYATLAEAGEVLEKARAARLAAKNPGYILGAKPDPAKLAETQERLAKRRAAVRATE